MRSVPLALVLGCAALACPASARAEPILAVFSATAGASVTLPAAASGGAALDLGTIRLGGGSSVIVSIDGLSAHVNVPVTFSVIDPAGNPFTALTAEILDPLSDGFDRMDPRSQPAYVPAGYSTSNNTDGLSFAWNSGLARSAVFAGGGAATLHADEDSNARDMLSFHGFNAGNHAKVSFGLRDNRGGRGFLVRLSVNGKPGAASTPEPASLLLLGTAVTGLLWFGRQLF